MFNPSVTVYRFCFEASVSQMKDTIEPVEYLRVVGDGENRSLLFCGHLAQQVHNDSRPTGVRYFPDF
jgi:hypothetical protein